MGRGKTVSKRTLEPVIIPRAEHIITRNAISSNALKVLYRLHNEGFSAFLVGGCVRDLLLGGRPKDFDVATDASPEEVRKLFRNSRIIGRRFRLVHVVFGPDTIEVATFRTHHDNAEAHEGQKSHQGMILRDNVYGSIEDDVWRRDFSINALYYNIADFSVIDYTGGMQDLQQRMIKMIGQPEQRYQEDPVRLLRAIRFMAKLNLNISSETEEPLLRLSHLLDSVSSARLFQEVLKIFQGGALLQTVKLLQKYHLFAKLFPQTAETLHKPETMQLLELALRNTDARIKEDKTVSPAFLFAVFLWHPITQQTMHYEEEGLPPPVAIDKAIRSIMGKQTQKLAIPRRIIISVREICVLQYRFVHRYGKRPFRLLAHPRFRAAYDLLILRSQAGEHIQELSQWWQQFHEADETTQNQMLKKMNRSRPKRKEHPKE